MRAVLEEWARDRKSCINAMWYRSWCFKPTTWSGRLIYELMGIILKGHRDDANLMKQFADGASILSEARSEPECRVARVNKALPDAWVPRVFRGLKNTVEWKKHKYLPLVLYQVWSRVDPTKATAFRDHLGAHFTCHDAAKFVDVEFLAEEAEVLDTLLPETPAATPPAGELKLALIDVARRRKNANPRSIDYLRALLGTEHRFSKALDLPGKLAGLATESEILVAIGRATPSGSKPPVPNVDADHDGVNDLYVEPMTKTGKVGGPSAVMYERPDDASKQLAALAAGEGVRIIGQVDPTWYACEHDGKLAFAHVADLEV
jgi:hypothetical protein